MALADWQQAYDGGGRAMAMAAAVVWVQFIVQRKRAAADVRWLAVSQSRGQVSHRSLLQEVFRWSRLCEGDSERETPRTAMQLQGSCHDSWPPA